MERNSKTPNVNIGQIVRGVTETSSGGVVDVRSILFKVAKSRTGALRKIRK